MHRLVMPSKKARESNALEFKPSYKINMTLNIQIVYFKKNRTILNIKPVNKTLLFRKMN